MPRPAAQRAAEFEKIARGIPERLKILNDLAAAYDEREKLKNEENKITAELQTMEGGMKTAGLNVEQVKLSVGKWVGLDEKKLAEAIKELLGSDKNLDIVTKYAKKYSEKAKVDEQLMQPETGKEDTYKNARKALDKLNLTTEQIDSVLEMSGKSYQRAAAVEKLESEFADRKDKIAEVVKAYDGYYPYRGGLDDPKDLQRMLKGTGVLEFRILPTTNRTELSADEIRGYMEALKDKGPKAASDKNYIWCEIENPPEWKKAYEIVAPFGNKYYVLASNRVDADECMLHIADQEWKLVSSYPGQDQMGRRAIDFTLDDRGGKIFSQITGKNIGRPLCILLDGIAISAPNINDRISTRGIITGVFSATEVIDMVNKLNAGSLPAKLIQQPISVKTIGPSIGAENRDKGIKSGLIGLIIVIAFMMVYYTVGGAIANVALLMNVLFILALMAMLKATYTLSGIAGTILTIGMSIDANVLIFERIREEQARGCSLRMAIKNGYEKAFSAIFDSNLTTIITAAILYYVASEEIKGFAIVLMLGLASSMFTALFVTRAIFDFLMNKKILKNHLAMMHLIRVPNINWMGLRPLFFTLSAILTIGGVVVFFTRDDAKNNKYDIEFTGGTSAQINLKENVSMTRDEVEKKIRDIGKKWHDPGLESTVVQAIETSGKQYEIITSESNRTKANITLQASEKTSVEAVLAAIEKAQSDSETKLAKLTVTQDSNLPNAFVITTTQLNKSIITKILTAAFPKATISEPQPDNIVDNAIMAAFGDDLAIQQNLNPKIISTAKIDEKVVDAYPELVDFLGGIEIKCEIEKTATAEEIDQRLKNLHYKPEAQNLSWYTYKILGTDLNPLEAKPVKSFVYVSTAPEAGLRQLSEEEWTQFVNNETSKVLAAAQIETSLPRVTQIDPSVGSESKTRALIAIILSLFAMLVYIWLRFGDKRYGFGAVITLFHDTCVTVGVVTACTYIAPTVIGQKLLIGDFKIDMAMIAAFLTLLGYSINDTIVIYDRIRENQRKGILTAKLINDSINQTLSRTLLTGLTVFFVVLIMYIFGGTGLRGFNFAMTFGVILGTYSSIAISAPVLLIGGKAKDQNGKNTN